MKLYVGNLEYTITDLQLNDLFSSCGTVVSAKVIKDHYTRQSKNFGYVEMSSTGDGHRALSQLHGAQVNERSLVVKRARSRDKRLGKGW